MNIISASIKRRTDEHESDSDPSPQKPLSIQSIDLLNANQVTETFTVPNGQTPENNVTVTYSFPAPCSSTQAVQESTSTLLAARALAKAGQSERAWNALRSLFVVQGSNGFLPKYRYAADPGGTGGDAAFEKGPFYLSGTDIPSPRMFGDVPMSYKPSSEDAENYADILGIRGSGRLAAIPYHASFVLDIFYLSEQTLKDRNELQFFFQNLCRWHTFLHHRVLRGCSLPLGRETKNQTAGGINNSSFLQNSTELSHTQDPCYNIIHPWETSIEPSSPFWKEPLKPIIQKMTSDGWIPSDEMRLQSDFHYQHRHHQQQHLGYKQNYQSNQEYDEATTNYNAMLYLAECHRNATKMVLEPQNNTDNDNNAQELIGSGYERYLLSKCPFAMLDVSHASALARADADLNMIATIIQDTNGKVLPTKTQLVNLNLWSKQSRRVLNSLWFDHNDVTEREEQYGYFSQNVYFERNDADNSYLYNHTSNNSRREVVEPVAYNFLASWDVLSNFNFIGGITFPMLEMEGKFSFNCGPFPVWSVGDCDKEKVRSGYTATFTETHRNAIGTSAVSGTNRNSTFIYPDLNYLISTGLIRNGAEGLGSFLRNSTLYLICNLSISLTNYDIDTACGNDNVNNTILFGRKYDTLGNIAPQHATQCEMTSTQTAAVAYNVLIPDKPFTYVPAPPIRSSWVLVLICAELMVAFSIGLSCLILSLNLMRRLKKDDDKDAFVRLLRERRVLDEEDLYGLSSFDTGRGARSAAGSDADSAMVGGGGRFRLKTVEEEPSSSSAEPAEEAAPFSLVREAWNFVKSSRSS